MRKLPLLFSIIPAYALAAIYHVDQASTALIEDGSAAYPFKTIAQASAILSAGDTCTIHRGIYRETIAPTQSGSNGAPIRYVAYENDPVVVSGTHPVSSWELHSGNIYKATGVNLTLGDKNMLYFNGDAQQLARWPNDLDGDPYTYDAYYIETESGTFSDSYITNYRIPEYWTSGVMFWLGAHGGCAIQRSITGFDPLTRQLSFTTLPNVWPFNTHSPTNWQNGHRGIFYLMNHLDALDAPGEWYYDDAANTLYFYAPGGVDPSTATIEVAVRDYSLNSDKNFIEFEKLNLFGASVRIAGSDCALSDMRLRHCVAGLITDSPHATAGGSAISVSGDRNRIERCLIEEGSSIAISNGSSADGTVIENNVIRNFNKIGNHGQPIRSTGPNATITRNFITGSARDGAWTSGAGSVFSYNEVSRALLSCQDGGLFYTVGNSTPVDVEVHHNWFHTANAPAYTGGKAAGIYLDNDTSGYTVHHNVVWNTSWFGMVLNWDALENEVYNNTFWETGAGYATIGSWVPVRDGVQTDVRDNTFMNNLSDVRDWWASDDDEMLDNTFQNNIQMATSPFVSLEAFNFMPVNEPAIVDQGLHISGITDGYLGSAPEIGAYEYGAERWVPGPDWTPESFGWLIDELETSVVQIDRVERLSDAFVIHYRGGLEGRWFELYTKHELGDEWSAVQVTERVDGTGSGQVSHLISSNRAFYAISQIDPPMTRTRVIEFNEVGYSNGSLSAHPDWNAESGWLISDSSGLGDIATSNDSSAAILNEPIVLSTGERYKLSILFELGGSSYATPSGWVYTFLAGLKADSTQSSVATGDAITADANLQIFSNSDSYRLLNNYSGISGCNAITTDQLNPGDVLLFDYELSLGVDASSTTYTVRIQNMTDDTDTGTGTVTGVHQTLYDALVGAGAHGFVQTLDPGRHGSGLNGALVKSVVTSVVP
ncbi:right-handed parallel beta-helix repeat-containing protein [Coraliomargarita akajimensis]|uniref:Right handed beta helix domain-containing protein n=1 Tax=Coraliomargarita akajimensis (strain DSM 45221 / IAM 15411 / JCM 23193 / KCTC 12865 / 04OKA010-24) TaxID=583355 RepID=D5EP06_CORAD|nr:right-handed parallel beta-helix repeat-containing protein [Coraliomargarita akajimensis]ADE53665.1 hypothetical protein Caka_0640 [Coraliomargarita akajimensis DSM 45221]